MAADPIVSRELKSLQEEISTSQRDHRSQTSDRVALTMEDKPAHRAAETAEEQKLRGELREFIDEMTKYVEDAEKNVSAHPAASVLSAFIVGILVGRLIGRR